MSATLVVDIGNSRIKYALATVEGLGEVYAQAHRNHRGGVAVSATESANAGRRLVNQENFAEVMGFDDILIASVARPAMKAAFLRQWGGALPRVRDFAVTPHALLRSNYAPTLGVDRWAAVLAAAYRFPVATSLLVVNVGTTTTIDMVQRSEPRGPAVFSGGVIVPGPGLMLASLGGQTARLPMLEVTADLPLGMPPRDTVAAMYGGVMAAQLGAVEWMYGDMAKRHGAPLVVVGGGGGRALAAHLSSTWEVVVADALVLWGLWCSLARERGWVPDAMDTWPS